MIKQWVYSRLINTKSKDIRVAMLISAILLSKCDFFLWQQKKYLTEELRFFCLNPRHPQTRSFQEVSSRSGARLGWVENLNESWEM